MLQNIMFFFFDKTVYCSIEGISLKVPTRVWHPPRPVANLEGKGRRIGRRAQEQSRRKEEKKIEVMSEGQRIGRRGIRQILQHDTRQCLLIVLYSKVFSFWDFRLFYFSFLFALRPLWAYCYEVRERRTKRLVCVLLARAGGGGCSHILIPTLKGTPRFRAPNSEKKFYSGNP